VFASHNVYKVSRGKDAFTVIGRTTFLPHQTDAFRGKMLSIVPSTVWVVLH